MAQLQPAQAAFISRRRRLTRAWPFVGGGLLAALALFSGWLYVKNPLLINPLEIVQRLQGGGLDPSTLMTMAGLLPVVFLSSIFLVLLLILFTFAKFRTESKYLALLEELDSPRS